MSKSSLQGGNSKAPRPSASRGGRMLSPQEELAVLRNHVKIYDEKYLGKNRIPEKHIWRPYRFAVRDVIIGIVVIKHNTRDNTLEVDVCLTEDPPFFEEYMGTKMVTLFLLSEAFMCGSSMGIQFTQNVRGKRVPPTIYDLAYLNGVKLKHAENGQITPHEARQLYLNLTGFSKEVQSDIKRLAVQDKVTPERICYMVNNGIWTREEMEILVTGSTFPENVILGGLHWEQLLLLENNLLQARTACMAGALLRKLAHREVIQDNKVTDLEANERILRTRYDYHFHALEITCGEDLEIPWVESGPQKVKAGGMVIVKLLSRERAALGYFHASDLASFKELIAGHEAKQKKQKKHFYLLAPLDVSELNPATVRKFQRTVEKLGGQVMISPDPVSEFDKDAISRLERSEITRK